VTARLLVAAVGMTAVVLAALVVPLGIANARSERRDLEAKVERDAQALSSIVEDGLERADPAVVASGARLARAYEARTGGRVVVVRRNGVAVVDSEGGVGRSFRSRPEIAAALAGRISVGTRPSRTLGTDLLYVAVPVASSGRVHGAVRVTYPTSEVDRRVRRFWLVLAGISLSALAAAAAVGVVLARWATRPLTQLETAADLAGAGDLTARAPVEGPHEVRAVAVAFNAMVARLEELLSAQEAFVADASHQLRTPLTGLRLRLENLERDVGANGEETLAAAAAEVERLSDLVDGLLAIARADHAASSPGEVDLASVARDRVAAWAALAEERALAFRLEPSATSSVRAGRDRLDQVLDNLLSNAFEAVGPGGEVEVSTAVDGAHGEIRVRDDGPGLADDEKRAAFDRFWRKRATPGSGLGLAISRRLVEFDGGTIHLEDAPGGGTVAVVRLPLVDGRLAGPGTSGSGS
jgi:signal transduction histidine kinase